MAVDKTEASNEAIDKIEGMFGGGKAAEEVQANEAEALEAEQTSTEDGQEPAVEAKTEPEEREVEIDGEKYLVPAKIADRFIQHADYTRKTQDIAEMRRALSAEREVTTLNKAFDEATQVERSRLSVLNAQIEQYKSVDWGSIEDTGQLVKMREQLNQLKEQRSDLQAAVKDKREEFDGKIKSHVQEAMQAGEKYCQQHIKDWNESTKKDLFNFGVSIGYTQAEMDKLTDPRIVVSLWEQMQWRNLQGSKAGVLNKAAQAAPQVRPGATTKPTSRISQLSKAMTTAKTPQGKKQAAEDYFTAKFGG